MRKTVIFVWSTEDGECYDCGLPAAFRRGEADKLCAICAAQSAADGEVIERIWDEQQLDD